MLMHEFWYNWEYAKKHNPRLMQFGSTGGFGCHRASMMKAVEGGDRVRAEKYFWLLIEQSLIETKNEEEVIGIGDMDELIDTWHGYLLRPDELCDETYFVRPAQADSVFQVRYALFKQRRLQ